METRNKLNHSSLMATPSGDMRKMQLQSGNRSLRLPRRTIRQRKVERRNDHSVLIQKVLDKSEDVSIGFRPLNMLDEQRVLPVTLLQSVGRSILVFCSVFSTSRFFFGGILNDFRRNFGRELPLSTNSSFLIGFRICSGWNLILAITSLKYVLKFILEAVVPNLTMLDLASPSR